MKRVKVCNNCLLYNDRRLSNCKECNGILEPEILEVSKELTHHTVVEEVIEEKPLKRDTEQFIVCQDCETLNNSKSMFCISCGNKLVEKEINLTEKVSSKVFNLYNNEINFNLEFTNESKSIGRKELLNSRNNDLISRNHFSYYINGNNELVIIDSSTNGTFINGIKLLKNRETLFINVSELTLANIVLKVKNVS